MAKQTDDYAKNPVSETLDALKVDAEKGLSSEEVKKRLARYGYNEIEEGA